MKIIPFKILILAILLPPILYLLTVTSLENYLQNKYEKEITNIYLSDMDDILNGFTSVKNAIDTSVTDYLSGHIFLRLGGKIDVNVATNQGNILYPSTYQNATFDNLSIDPARLAEKNFEILNEGVDLNVDVEISHYSLLAIGLLIFYVFLIMSSLYGYYRNVSLKIQRDELQKNKELNRLQELENKRLKQIDQLSEERMLLLDEYDQLKSTFQKEKSQAEKTEEDLFEEIETLENKLNEIDQLKTKIAELEKSRSHLSKQKEKSIEKLGKRFKALYKNIELTQRALNALTDMTEDMSLKAEEIIHQLNSDPDLVSVKRKVFSKKGKTTSFEVVFAYNGRLYFRRTNGNRIKILTIGSKNTQAKDLAFVDNI